MLKIETFQNPTLGRTETEAAGKIELIITLRRGMLDYIAKEWQARELFNQLSLHKTTKCTPSVKATLASSLRFEQKTIPSVYFLTVLNTRRRFKSEFRYRINSSSIYGHETVLIEYWNFIPAS